MLYFCASCWATKSCNLFLCHSPVGILVWSHITWCGKGLLKKQDNVIHTGSLNFFFLRGNYWFVSILYTALQRFNVEEWFIPWRNTGHDCSASCPLTTFNIGLLYTAALTYKASQLVSNNINYICMPLSWYFIQLCLKNLFRYWSLWPDLLV